MPRSSWGKRGQATLTANAQLPPLKVAAVWFDKLVILDPVGVETEKGDSKLKKGYSTFRVMAGEQSTRFKRPFVVGRNIWVTPVRVDDGTQWRDE